MENLAEEEELSKGAKGKNHRNERKPKTRQHMDPEEKGFHDRGSGHVGQTGVRVGHCGQQSRPLVPHTWI